MQNAAFQNYFQNMALKRHTAFNSKCQKIIHEFNSQFLKISLWEVVANNGCILEDAISKISKNPRLSFEKPA